MGKKKVNKSLDKLRKSLQNKQFVKAIFSLHKMSKQKQAEAIMQASPQFIRDICHVLSILRNHPNLMNAKLRKRSLSSLGGSHCRMVHRQSRKYLRFIMPS